MNSIKILKINDRLKIYRAILLSIYLLIMIFIYIPQVYALNVDASQELLDNMAENKDISFEIDISDYSYANYISIETNIMKTGNEPIFDFGYLNERYTNIDKYKQSVVLDIPKDINRLKVKITGKTPSGTSVLSDTNNVEIIKFTDGSLKYFEVKLLGNEKEDLGQKNKEIRSFRLIVNEKLAFEKSLKDITWGELDGVKDVAKDMFDRGLVKDAKKLVLSLKEIESPEDEGLLPYNDNWKNILLAIVIVVIFYIGIAIGQRKDDQYENIAEQIGEYK